VQIDYRHDEFASSMFNYFPRKLAIRPGDTVEFKQVWTGEPHSVTMGTLIDQNIRPIVQLVEKVEKGGAIPEGEPPEFETFSRALPFALGGSEAGLTQNAAQPCYVDASAFTGTYPGDEKTPCPKRAQPAFNGRQAIYSSGIIPFEGVGGNTFTVKLADDLKPGTYSFYCNVHGPLQYGELQVEPKGTTIPSKAEVARETRREAEARTAPLLRNYRAAQRGAVVTGGDQGEVKVDAGKNHLVGVPTPSIVNHKVVHGIVDEFVPKRLEAKVGQKVTWTFIGGHTISFNVPKYFPVFTIAKDGKVTFNPKADEPVGGWPDRPAPPGGDNSDSGPPPPPVKVDAGAWDGSGFHSTGLNYHDEDQFSVTFTKAGTYDYACLIHPQMVGKVVVKS
jgi:plastocyanin